MDTVVRTHAFRVLLSNRHLRSHASATIHSRTYTAAPGMIASRVSVYIIREPVETERQSTRGMQSDARKLPEAAPARCFGRLAISPSRFGFRHGRSGLAYLRVGVERPAIGVVHHGEGGGEVGGGLAGVVVAPPARQPTRYRRRPALRTTRRQHNTTSRGDTSARDRFGLQRRCTV
eukprot:1178370-Prorocentrum_minimum.AAC.6